MSEEKKQQLLRPFYTEETEQVLAEVQTTEEGFYRTIQRFNDHCLIVRGNYICGRLS